jgi:hypothetical protein
LHSNELAWENSQQQFSGELMNKIAQVVLACSMSIAFAASALAHHSAAAFDTQWSGQWQYRPNMPHSNEKCDLEVARKFLRDY